MTTTHKHRQHDNTLEAITHAKHNCNTKSRQEAMTHTIHNDKTKHSFPPVARPSGPVARRPTRQQTTDNDMHNDNTVDLDTTRQRTTDNDNA